MSTRLPFSKTWRWTDAFSALPRRLFALTTYGQRSFTVGVCVFAAKPAVNWPVRVIAAATAGSASSRTKAASRSRIRIGGIVSTSDVGNVNPRRLCSPDGASLRPDDARCSGGCAGGHAGRGGPEDGGAGRRLGGRDGFRPADRDPHGARPPAGRRRAHALERGAGPRVDDGGADDRHGGHDTRGGGADDARARPPGP